MKKKEPKVILDKFPGVVTMGDALMEENMRARGVTPKKTRVKNTAKKKTAGK